MRRYLFLCFIFSILISTTPVFAHEGFNNYNAFFGEFFHIFINVNHFFSFTIIGVIGGLYNYLFGQPKFVGFLTVYFIVMASLSHINIKSEAGFIFSLGFIGAGLLSTISTAYFVNILIKILRIPTLSLFCKSK
jgi:hypothetical protein